MHAKQAPVQHVLADQRKKKNYVEFWSMIPIKDPFRLVLSEMRDRLFHTREVLHHCLSQPSVCAPPARLGPPCPITPIMPPIVTPSCAMHSSRAWWDMG